MIPRIEDVINPVVGRRYDVPLAEYDGREGLRIVPIIGDIHADPQFGVRYGHYHMDGRFVGRKLERKLDMVDGITNMIVRFDSACVKLYRSVRRCRRLETGINPPSTARADLATYGTWYRGFHGMRCAGNRCPHLGTPMLKHFAGLKCPLHGLKANAGGIIIPQWQIQDGFFEARAEVANVSSNG